MRTAVLAALLAGAFVACTRVESAKPPPNVSIGDAGTAGQGEGGMGNGAGDGGGGHSGSAISMSGAPPGAELGFWPTFSSEPQGGGDDPNPEVDAVLASVAALSAGSEALPIYLPWNVLSEPSGMPSTKALARLDAITRPYRDRGKKLALCIGIVDRTRPAWPFASELGSAEAVAALERTIDQLYARYADALSHLCFGYELDRYLAIATVAQGQRLAEFLAAGIAYAKKDQLPGIAVGVAVTLSALSRADSVLELLPRGDELVAVYDALAEDGSLKPPQSASTELEGALDALPEVDGARLPLTLFEAGYPERGVVGASELAQREFFEAIFTTLDARAESISFIGLFGLGDRSPAECEAEARAFGGSPAALSARAQVRCSIGLRAVTGPRLAWPVALSALSRYR